MSVVAASLFFRVYVSWLGEQIFAFGRTHTDGIFFVKLFHDHLIHQSVYSNRWALSFIFLLDNCIGKEPYI